MSGIREQRLKRLAEAKVVLVTDRQRSLGRTLESVVHESLEGGARAVQLRAKDMPEQEFLQTARALAIDCREHGALYIVNSRADIVVETGADGVHLPGSGMPITEARRICGQDVLIGRSVHSVDEAAKAEDEGADYLQIGTIFPTDSKPGAPTGGLELVSATSRAVSVPVTAIGGINQDTICPVLGAGAAGAAVISAISGADNVRLATQEMLRVAAQCLDGRSTKGSRMKIEVNGQEREIEEGMNLTGFLSSFGVEPRRVIVEHNGEILPRDGYEHVVLREGDKLEIVHFVGGGCV